MSRGRSGIKFEDVVARDVELLWSIQDYVYHWPWLDRQMSKIVSKQPWNDIGLVVWLIALMGCFELGVRHFWVVTTNIGSAFLLNRLIRAKRPVEYDIRLQPTTDLHPDSYGFPSLESHMSVVVIGHLFKSTMSWVVLFFGIPLILLVGFSRLYSRSRLPHQVLGSYVSGILGLLVGIHYCERMGGGFHNMPKHSHGVWVGVVVVIFLGNLALNMENNDSRLLYVSRADFLRVMRGIMYAGQEQVGEAGTGAVPRYDDGDENESEMFMDATASGEPQTGAAQSGGRNGPSGAAFAAAAARHMQQDGMSRRKRNLANRKDSFYFLQKQLQSRAGEGGAGTLTKASPRNSDSSNL